ncbi:MAG: polyprenyl synthetase family protein [Methanomassiliicoccales archaeon]|jgi:geranylgeranyl diphosphate synthase type I|nr:polyprenyl synthetase family protein [Methanomassiliicoccales archaeon]
MNVLEELARRAKMVDASLMEYLEVGKYEKLRKAVRHYPEAGGKRLRPSMAYTVAEAVGRNGKDALPFGCALELIHNFTLVHDDVMDQDATRRGRPTVHTLYGMPTAIIAGDALFAIAYKVLATTPVDGERLRRLLASLSDTVYLVAEGQQMDIDFESRDDVTVEEYMEMVEKKTAVLFACAAEGGAIIGGGTEDQIQDMYEYARLSGIGFQIWDDVLGLIANEKVLGKPVGSDIRNGKRTLIAVHAFEELGRRGAREHAEVLRAFGNEKATDAEVRKVIALFQELGSIQHGKDVALDYAARAKEKLCCLPPSKEKDFLREVVDFSVGREK